MTFDDLCVVEPRLLALAAEAARFGETTAGETTFCANAVWYGYDGGGLKERLCKLVGHERDIPGYVRPALAEVPNPFRLDDPNLLANMAAEKTARRAALDAMPPDAAAVQRLLCTSEAYDVAYHHVYNLLPDCRGACACSGITLVLTGRE